MNKIGHLLVTKKVSENLLPGYRFWLLLGSIAPDLFLTTYIKGHIWETTFEENSIEIENLLEHGCSSRKDYFKMGYYLHYIEDYFTYPHNSSFPGMLLAHIVYEKDLTTHLISEKNNPSRTFDGMDMHGYSVDILYMYLKVLHDDYLTQKMCVKTDRKYIFEAAGAYMQCMTGAIACNALNKGRQNPLPTIS